LGKSTGRRFCLWNISVRIIGQWIWGFKSLDFRKLGVDFELNSFFSCVPSQMHMRHAELKRSRCALR
jgi:hypothetical protein